MASKNKGGREARKPKADKKSKPAAPSSVVPLTNREGKSQPGR